MKILTIGYGNLKPSVFFTKLEALKPDLIVDVRHDPWHSWSGAYKASHLMLKYPNYMPIPALGNKTKTLPPEYVDYQVGFRQLLMMLSPEWRVFGKTIKFPPINTVVLLCAELDENKCHRKYVKLELTRILHANGIPVEEA